MLTGLFDQIQLRFCWMVVSRRGARSVALTFKGREFSKADLELVREVVSTCGGLKVIECKELLERLEADGLLQLPALARTKPRGTRTRIPRTERGEPGERIVGTVRDVAPLVLKRVTVPDDRLLWRELVGRHHYLGHKVPFGAHLRYLIEVSHPVRRVVGCLQVSSPAWKMAPRDRWIGWSDEARQRNLQRVVNNSRFLLLPWVEVRNLASSALALMARQMPDEWEEAYRTRPVLLETLVDERRFAGTCYLAANWTRVGVTTGRGRMDRYSQQKGAHPKAILVYPLHRRARQILSAGTTSAQARTRSRAE